MVKKQDVLTKPFVIQAKILSQIDQLNTKPVGYADVHSYAILNQVLTNLVTYQDGESNPLLTKP
jgi:hypothetical protein